MHNFLSIFLNFLMLPNFPAFESLGNVLGAKATVTGIMNNLNRPEGGGKVAQGRACNTAGLATDPRPPFQQYAVAIDRSKILFKKNYILNIE